MKEMEGFSEDEATELEKNLKFGGRVRCLSQGSDSYVETSASGGTVSLIAFTTMALLTVIEFSVYQDTWKKYEYEVDKDFSSKLRINIDITVAMKCHYVGADVLDLAETMVASADGLAYEPALFDLSPQQREWQR
ncbi:endoplasmic reticulum-Golgi intermediate compartment protein 2-like [Rattus rattus]|uniref:endoplasmic reticulum-Golgi intermediate compartment protein 2-like n=1 Tax=Rattus rattus TaxID=10117 RepID=UPI0013F2ED74|nr:endoplasmic reticulum-Golgi intermediate compartment protein 2-like [Rattus rattus]